MPIGLLICDHIAPEFAGIAGQYPDFFAAWLPEVEWRLYWVVDNEFPASPEECDAWFCTGSKASVYDDEPWIQRLKTFVQAIAAAGTPYVGICFGHQMLAEALGGKVARAENGWCVGIHTFQPLQPATGFSLATLPGHLNLPMMCQDQVQVLPPGAVVLASGDDCPVAAMLVNGHMLGIQGHPEFPTEYSRALIQHRKPRIGEVKADAALHSLDLRADGEEVKKQILRFVRDVGDDSVDGDDRGGRGRGIGS